MTSHHVHHGSHSNCSGELFQQLNLSRPNHLNPWQYNRALNKKRNEIERLFRRLKRFRGIFSRFEKLDVVFLAFLYFALVVEACM